MKNPILLRLSGRIPYASLTNIRPYSNFKGDVTLVSKVIRGLLSLAVITAALAQEPARYSSKQLHRLMDYASTAADFQRLATYFHYQELVFRTKAQKMVDEYASVGACYPMATKTISRTEVESRLYKEYSAKAEEDSKLAARYDEILLGMGIKPETISANLVSAKSTKEDSPATPGSALVSAPK